MKLIEKQGWHFIFMIIFIGFAYLFSNYQFQDSPNEGQDPSKTWFWACILVAVAHTIYVVIFWRLELHYKWVSNTFGEQGFSIFAFVFLLFLISRPITVILLAINDSDTFSANPALINLAIVVCSLLSGYAGYSVARYFGFKRAMGQDHFDHNSTNQKFVKKGIFRFTDNGMYLFGFLALYIPGLIWYSKSALFVAFWSHLYIWVHFFFTEKVDFKYIYKKAGNQSFRDYRPTLF